MPRSRESLDISFTQNQLQQFAQDVDSLCVPSHIPILDHPPDRFTFLRDYVWPSRPCIIRNAILNPQSNLGNPLILTLEDLIQICGENKKGEEMKITVDVTPDGRGDCVRSVLMDTQSDGSIQKMFVKPLQVQMTLSSFRDELRKGYSNLFTKSTTAKEDEEDQRENRNEPQQTCDAQGLALLSISHSSNTLPLSQSPSIYNNLPQGVYYYSLQNNFVYVVYFLHFGIRVLCILPPTFSLLKMRSVQVLLK